MFLTLKELRKMKPNDLVLVSRSVIQMDSINYFKNKELSSDDKTFVEKFLKNTVGKAEKIEKDFKDCKNPNKHLTISYVEVEVGDAIKFFDGRTPSCFTFMKINNNCKYYNYQKTNLFGYTNET